MQANPDLTAIFCINDECAQGAYSAITAAGQNIENYSVNAGPEAKAAITKMAQMESGSVQQHSARSLSVRKAQKLHTRS